jgi:hypothetical protein
VLTGHLYFSSNRGINEPGNYKNPRYAFVYLLWKLITYFSILYN